MPKQRRLHPEQEWVELSSTAADWKAADPGLLVSMLAQLHLIRAFEETVLEFASEGLVNGPAHSSIGQEGGAVGAVAGLRTSDGINGSHRSHHQFLAKAISHVSDGDVIPVAIVTEAVTEVLDRTFAEILGLARGYCVGRGGSIHLQWLAAGALGSNAIVGGGVPLAAGNAFAQQRSGTDDVTVSFFGDGAMNIGSTLETMNLAAAWKLPLCFFVENNMYAVATTNDEVTAEPRLSARGPGFGIPAWRVDGMDPLAVHLAMTQAGEVMRSGGGPTLVEAQVYRYFHQNGAFVGSAFGYRTKEEEEGWRRRDPLTRLETEVRRLGHLTSGELGGLRTQATDAMATIAASVAETDPERAGRRRIRPDLWPDPATVDDDLLGDTRELAGARFLDPATDDIGPAPTARYVDGVSAVLGQRLADDERFFVLGEDVHRLGGGTNGVTRQALELAPDQVLGTPISENAFAGLAAGAALDGRFRPVVEFMYPDFLWVAADQVFNQIGRARHMFGGNTAVPLVLRTKVAIGSGYGSQHSMDPAGIFATSPGWRIVAPSNAADYIGLMNTALDLEDPVLVLEHVDLYGHKEPVPEDVGYRMEVGRAALRRTGADVTVISYLSMVRKALEAVEKSGVDADVVDLRWLDAASLDWDTLETSIRKTNAVLIVEEGARGTSYGGWLADEIQRRFFDWLDAPIERVTGSLSSPSISRVLEAAARADVDDVVAGLERVHVARGLR